MERRLDDVDAEDAPQGEESPARLGAGLARREAGGPPRGLLARLPRLIVVS